MVPTAWFTFTTLIFLTPIEINCDKSGFCKTSEGGVGKCIESKICPSSSEKCGDGKVCCPVMAKIVTPNDTPGFPTSPPATSLPPVTLPGFPTSPPPTAPPVTTSPVPNGNGGTTQSTSVRAGAAAKCEEYKHKVKKRASIVTYVFGGTASIGKEFPHMAILGYGKPDKIDWLCGGSLISEHFVVTAAHCSTSVLGDLIRVRLGELDLESVADDATPQDYNIADKIIHPDYHRPSQYNDIALIRLDRQVDFSAYIAPICLQTNKNLPNTNFIATGWGRTELGGSQSDILMKVDLDYFPNDVCQRNYEDVLADILSRGIVDDTQICAGSHEEEKDTCQGDSGGPLQIRDDALYLVGITSFGKACGVVDSPAVYTRVSYYVPWIEGIVWP